MKKRVFSLFLVLALCLTLLPAPVWAEEADTHAGTGDPVYTVDADTTVQSGENNVAVQANTANVAEVTIGGNTTPYTDIDAAFAAAQEADSATVTLLADVTISHTNDTYGIKLEKGNITLDLNGKTLSKSTCDDNGFYSKNAVFWLSPAGVTTKDEFLVALQKPVRLTVQDSSADENGKIVQPNGGPAIIVTFNTILTVNGGTVENESSVDHDNQSHMAPNCAVLLSGGGKAVIDGGTLRGMRGVAVTGYITKEEEDLYKEYFGIEGYNNDTYGNELTVTGGEICATSGEALIVYEKAKKIELSGGTFTTQSKDYSIWVDDTEDGEQTFKGDAASLLASGYRYEYNGTECAYSENGKGVKGNAKVALRPANEYTYIDANGKEKTQTNCTDITTATGDLKDGWYVVNGDVTKSNLYVFGTVNLILCDGAEWSMPDSGLYMGDNAVLNIYAQSAGTGKLTATGVGTKPAIGMGIDKSGGTLNIYGGEITATSYIPSPDASGEASVSESRGAAIGICGNSNTNMTVNIYGGTVTAKATYGAAAIGKGQAATGTVDVTIADGMKCVKTGEPNVKAAYNNTEGDSVTIMKCVDHQWSYTTTDATHTAACTLCDTKEAEAAHEFSKLESMTETTHTFSCVCGAVSTGNHTSLSESPNADGLTHTGKCGICVYSTTPEKHSFTLSGGMCTCFAYLTATYNDQNYATLASAVAAAAEDGGTVTLEIDTAESITVTDGMDVTIDLNGKTWFTTHDDRNKAALTVDGGSVTVKNGTLQTGSMASACTPVVINGGSLTVGEGMTIQGNEWDDNRYCHAIEVNGGKLTLNVDTVLYCGMKVAEGKLLKDYLPEGTAFAKDDGSVIDGYVQEYVGKFTLIVVEHTKHTVGENNKCDCGFSCTAHDFKNGVCTVCGYVCPHGNVGETGVCTACDFQMPVRMGSYYYATLQAAFDKAENGFTICLLADIPAEGTLTNETKKTVYLSLDGHKLTETASGITIGSGATLKIGGIGWSVADDSLTSSYTFRVQNGGRLELGNWSELEENPYVFQNILIEGSALEYSGGAGNKINTLWIGSATAEFQLSGGRYGRIIGTSALQDSVTAKQLLNIGYVFQKEDGSLVPYTTEITKDKGIEDVTIASCTHAHIGADRTCEGCGLTNIVAIVNGSVYCSAENQTTDEVAGYAFDALSNYGGKLTLYTNANLASNVTITKKGSHTIDLNGHTISGYTYTLTVENGVEMTVTDSSEEKTGSFSWVTVKDGGSLIVDGTTIKWIFAKEQNTSVLLKAGSQFYSIDLSDSGHILADCLESDGCLLNEHDSIYVSMISSGTPYVIGRIPGSITLPENTNVSISYGGRVSNSLLPKVTLDDEDNTNLIYQWRYRPSSGGSRELPSTEPKAGETLDVFCVVSAMDTKGNDLWETIVTGYTLTVTKGQAAVTKAPKAVESLTYNGEAQVLVTEGAANGGTMQYSLEQNGTYSTEIPTGKDAKAYTVWYKVVGDGNHNGTEPQSIPVTIAPKTVTNPTIEVASCTYDGEEQKPTVTVKDENGKEILASEYTVTYANNKNAGEDTATVTITDNAGGNYTVSGSTTFSIAKAAAPTLKDVTHSQRYTMTDGAVSLADAGMPSDAGTLTYEQGTETKTGNVTISSWDVDSTGNVTYTLTGGQVDDTVTLPVKISSTNYTDTTVNIVITLTDRDTPEVTANAITVTYDGSAVSAEKITGSTTFNGNTVDGTWSWAGNQSLTNVSDSGEKTVIFTPTDTINYKPVETTIELTIEPVVVTVSGITAPDKVYDGTTNLDTNKVELSKAVLEGVLNGDSVSVQIDPAYAPGCQYSSKNAGEVTAYLIVELTGADAKNYTLSTSTLSVPAKITPKDVTITGVTAENKTYDGSTDAKNPSANIDGVVGGDDVQLSIGEASFADKNVGTGKTVTFSQLSLTGADAANYNLITTGPVTATANITAKKLESFSITEKETKYYDGTNALNVTGVTALNTVRGDDVYVIVQKAYFTGTDFSAGSLKQAKVEITLGGRDAANYQCPAAININITIHKATPTGAPKYTAITQSGRKLSDAALSTEGGTFSVSGTVKWVDANGADLSGDTEVKANTSYEWVFTPADEANYNEISGSVTLYSVSSSGGGGGSSTTTTKTETTTNPDGSVTKTETKSDGTVIETTTNKDGSTTKTETKKDGSSKTEIKDANGSTGTVNTDKDGNTTAEAKITDKAISDAKKSDEAVKIPAEVTPGEDSASAPTVKIDLPKSAGETKIEIPVKDATGGTVAVIVKPDGTEEIVKDSVPTENGIQLTVDGDVTVKLVDNAKGFTDIGGHWAEDSIDFVSARDLVNGTSESTFSPDAPTTRAQLWTILARQANADLTGGASWYEKAQAWAKESGISDGFNPDGTITRAQMVTMLWRAAGSPEVTAETVSTDVPAGSYYAKAVAWAVERGITTGVGNGKFAPDDACTRAQVAAFLHRSY